MDSQLPHFGAIKIRHALDRIDDASTLHEGLYSAFVEDLQWLNESGDFPLYLTERFRNLVNALISTPAPDVVASARETISGMTALEGAAFARLMVELLKRLNAADHNIGDS